MAVLRAVYNELRLYELISSAIDITEFKAVKSEWHRNCSKLLLHGLKQLTLAEVQLRAAAQRLQAVVDDYSTLAQHHREMKQLCEEYSLLDRHTGGRVEAKATSSSDSTVPPPSKSSEQTAWSSIRATVCTPSSSSAFVPVLGRSSSKSQLLDDRDSFQAHELRKAQVGQRLQQLGQWFAEVHLYLCPCQEHRDNTRMFLWKLRVDHPDLFIPRWVDILDQPTEPQPDQKSAGRRRSASMSHTRTVSKALSVGEVSTATVQVKGNYVDRVVQVLRPGKLYQVALKDDPARHVLLWRVSTTMQRLTGVLQQIVRSKHPNIAPVSHVLYDDANKVGSYMFVETPYYDQACGLSLKEFLCPERWQWIKYNVLQANQQLPPVCLSPAGLCVPSVKASDFVPFLLSGALAGLSQLLKQKICHGNLHWDNVLLDRVNNCLVPRLVDFEHSQVLQTVSHNNTVEMVSAPIVGVLLGEHFAPELRVAAGVATGTSTAAHSEKTELYSFGYLMQQCFMASGVSPPPDVQSLINRLLNTDPKVRPSLSEVERHPFFVNACRLSAEERTNLFDVVLLQQREEDVMEYSAPVCSVIPPFFAALRELPRCKWNDALELLSMPHNSYQTAFVAACLADSGSMWQSELMSLAEDRPGVIAPGFPLSSGTFESSCLSMCSCMATALDLFRSHVNASLFC